MTLGIVYAVKPLIGHTSRILDRCAYVGKMSNYKKQTVSGISFRPKYLNQRKTCWNLNWQ